MAIKRLIARQYTLNSSEVNVRDAWPIFVEIGEILFFASEPLEHTDDRKDYITAKS